MSRIVVTGRMPDAAIEKLRLEHEVDAWPGPESISSEELLRRVAGADAILSLLTERVDGELLDAAGPQLKVVANVAVGYDNIDVGACRERGVVATNTPGVLTEAMDRMGYTAVGDFAAVALHQTGVSFCTREHFGRRQPGEERQYIRLAYSGIEVADIREGLGRLLEWITVA